MRVCISGMHGRDTPTYKYTYIEIQSHPQKVDEELGTGKNKQKEGTEGHVPTMHEVFILLLYEKL